MPKDFSWGPVSGQKHRACTALLPLTPLKKLMWHTSLKKLHIKSFVEKCGIFFLLITVFSCKTTSPNTTKESLVSFATVETVEPQWQLFADGVDYFHGKIASPQLEFWALRIDLSAPDIRIVVRGGALTSGAFASGADEERTNSTKVSSFVRDNNLLAGINTVPFDVVSARENQPIKNMGLVISDGRLISPVNPNYDTLVFYKNGGAAIVSQKAIGSMENIENAVGGFHQILTAAQAAERTNDLESRHPRSAAGVSANGNFLYLLVIDGRRAGSEGSTEKETALLLRSLGCHDGINLDGGGSSALALRYPNGNIRTANTPVHGGIPGRERAVAGCLGIALSPSKGK